MTNGDPATSYTAVLQQVYNQLGRLEGKLDAYDTRMRVVENQIAAWQELVKVSTADSEMWKKRITDVEKTVGGLTTNQGVGAALREHWKLILALVILPLASIGIDVWNQVAG